MAALAVLPVPGKTFFNKLSKLPKNVRALIDDSLELCESVSKVFFILTEELGRSIFKAAKTAKLKSEMLKEQLATQEIIQEELEREANEKKIKEEMNG